MVLQRYLGYATMYGNGAVDFFLTTQSILEPQHRPGIHNGTCWLMLLVHKASTIMTIMIHMPKLNALQGTTNSMWF